MSDDGKYDMAWRVLCNHAAGPVEVEDVGIFDELVVGQWLHVEQMDDNVWWMRVGDAKVMVTLRANLQPTVDVDRGYYENTRGVTRTREERSPTRALPSSRSLA